jgi:NTE family protein
MDYRQSRQAGADEPVTLMLVGGGIRCYAFIGALRAVEEIGVPIGKIIGASTGSIIAALYASGMSTAELKQLALETDTEMFRDFSPRGVFSGMGVCRGDALERWLDDRLGGACLADLRRHPLAVITTDILNHAPLVVSAENAPRLTVSAAVRFSTAIPFIFSWKKFTLRGKDHVLIDGTLMASVIEGQYAEREKTLVLRTFSKRSMNHHASTVMTLRRYTGDLLNIFFHAMDREFLKGARWKDTITIHCGMVPSLSFSIPTDEREFLMEQGYQQTAKYLRYKWGL